MSFKLEWEPHGVVIRFGGTITIRDILDASTAYHGDYRFDNMRYVIADYSEITDCDAQPDEIDNVWAVDKGSKFTNPNIIKAIVSKNPKVKALRDCYLKYSYCDLAYPTEVFASEEAAREWIGITISNKIKGVSISVL